MSRLYFLYASTIFISAFLLFQVQPLLGKHLLPWFGGSPAVWITALFFFMGGLAVGYTYALLLTCLTRVWQVLVHSFVSVGVVLILFQNSKSWPSAITPGITDVSLLGDPVWVVFTILAVSVGLPFALLSSTSSLLQFWYGRASGQEPFSLYAISNAGSLLGLLSYPLLFERFLSTIDQGWWWVMGFVVYFCLLLVVLLLYLVQDTADKTIPVEKNTNTVPAARQFMIWLFLASIPIMTMVTATDYLTGYVIAVPFLWVIPLALYLLSFVVSFRSGDRLPGKYVYVFALLATMLALGAMNQSLVPVVPTVLLIFVAMFAVNHLCHEWLYALRPDKEYLAAFYVALAFGGIFASTIVLLASLYIVPLPIEFIFFLVATGLLSAVVLLYQYRSFLVQLHQLALPLVLACMCALLVSGFGIVQLHTSHVIASERNFFGFKAVSEHTDTEHGTRRTLIHGITNHGYQFIDSDNTEMHYRPIGYYSKTSGVGKGFAYLRDQNTDGLRVAVAGLGAGALAAYCQDGDSFTFFEIDPQIVTLAQDYFTYLDSCIQHEIVLGDARLSKADLAARITEPIYDFIILDAYADDAMPIHLMTTEAIAEYLPLLVDDGLLAIHISSRYLRLLPVIQALADDNNLVAYHRYDRDFSAVDVPSHWVLFSRSHVFSSEYFDGMEVVAVPRPRLWTDRYSSLLPLVRW